MPKINKFAGNKEVKNQDVGQRLYEVHGVHEDNKKKKKLEEEKKIKELANKKYVQDSSVKMAEKLEKEKLKTIFETLDSDHDGIISSSKIDISGKNNILCFRTFYKTS